MVATVDGWEIFLNEKANKGDESAQLILANFYANKSFYLKPNEESAARKVALDWAIKASETNDTTALYMVAKFYLRGIGTIKSDAKSAECGYKIS